MGDVTPQDFRAFLAAAAITVLASFAPITSWAETAEPPSSPSEAPATNPAPSDDLAASTAPPWNPEQPVPSADGWETALRFPGRVISRPLSGLGILANGTLSRIESSHLIERVSVILPALARTGILIGPAALGDRTGFGVAVGVSPPFLGHHLSVRWDGSTLEYSKTRVEAGYGPARLYYEYEWRPSERFYGLGPSSSEQDVSTFASQTDLVRLGLAHSIGTRGRGVLASGAAWAGPRQAVVREGRGDEDNPSFSQVFPALGIQVDRSAEHLVAGGRLGLDTRHGLPHWGHGVRLEAEGERFTRPNQIVALHTTHTPFQFTRWTYEAEGGLSFYRDPRTLRLMIQAVDNVPDVTGAMLLGDLATLGGSRGLVGFAPRRFADNDAVLARLSYIFPLEQRFEFDLHAETGQVCGDLWSDPTIGSLSQSFGIALRPRVDNLLLGSVGLDWCREGMRFSFSVGGVE